MRPPRHPAPRHDRSYRSARLLAGCGHSTGAAARGDYICEAAVPAQVSGGRITRGEGAGILTDDVANRTYLQRARRRWWWGWRLLGAGGEGGGRPGGVAGGKEREGGRWEAGGENRNLAARRALATVERRVRGRPRDISTALGPKPTFRTVLQVSAWGGKGAACLGERGIGKTRLLPMLRRPGSSGDDKGLRRSQGLPFLRSQGRRDDAAR